MLRSGDSSKKGAMLEDAEADASHGKNRGVRRARWDYFGCSCNRRPPSPSSSTQMLPSGLWSTSRMRAPMS